MRFIYISIFIAFIGIGLVLISYIRYQNIIVFCDVGQGNATLIQINQSTQLLVDTGPDKSVLSCLSNHMPFFDKHIEYLILSHFDQDHIGGAKEVLKRYSVGIYISPKQYSQTTVNNIPKRVERLIYIDAFLVTISEAFQSAKIDNNTSTTVTLHSPKQTFFLSGDIPSGELALIIPPDTTVLQVPHHGSKQALSDRIFSLAHPTYAVISVGKQNTYGHPARKTLDILKAHRIQVLRTDEKGDILFNIQ